MTVAQLEKAQAREALLFETAKRVRELLDAARKEYGAEDYDERDGEARILELVTEEP